jgi:hypothetical protein
MQVSLIDSDELDPPSDPDGRVHSTALSTKCCRRLPDLVGDREYKQVRSTQTLPPASRMIKFHGQASFAIVKNDYVRLA